MSFHVYWYGSDWAQFYSTGQVREFLFSLTSAIGYEQSASRRKRGYWRGDWQGDWRGYFRGYSRGDWRGYCAGVLAGWLAGRLAQGSPSTVAIVLGSFLSAIGYEQNTSIVTGVNWCKILPVFVLKLIDWNQNSSSFYRNPEFPVGRGMRSYHITGKRKRIV